MEVAFLHAADSVYYLTGVPLLSPWGRPMWAVMRADGSVAVIGSMIEKETMETYAWADEVRAYDDAHNVWDRSLQEVADLVTADGHRPTRIGVERSLLPVSIAEALDSKLGATLVEVGDLVFDARLIKSDEELALLTTTGEVAKVGANAFVEALSPGVSELAVAGHAVAEMNRAIAALWPGGATSTYAYCHLGEHTLSPHLHATDRRLGRGDVVALNVFPTIWGYCIELERTYIYGEPSDKQSQALNAVNEAFQYAKREFRPGKVISELHREASGILEREGYGEFIRHGTGHAHGIMIGAAGREEGGELRPYNHAAVRERTVNSIEPGVYIPGLGGFRHSDVMAVAADGSVRCLTDFPTEVRF